MQLSQGCDVSQDASQQPVDFENDALLDMGASFSSMIDDKMLDNAVKTDNSLQMGTNTGSKTLNEHGHLNSLKSRVWKDETGIANALSFAELADQHHMTCNNSKEDAFQIKDWNGKNDS